MYKKIIVIFSMLLLITACADQTADNLNEEDIVATVNGEVIAKDIYTQTVEQAKINYEMQDIQFDGENGNEMLEEIEAQVLDQLISQILLYQNAVSKGYEATAEEIDQQLAQVSTNFETKEAFNAALEQEDIMLDELKEQLKEQIVMSKLVEEVKQDIEVKDEEIEELYEEMTAMFGDELPNFDEYKDELKGHLIDDKIYQKLYDLAGELKEDSDIEINL